MLCGWIFCGLFAPLYQSVSPTALPVEGPYEAEWSSLENFEAVPDWMHDAKFGIYVHWGVYSVPA